MIESTVHDNLVTGYAVACDRRKLVIHTVYPYQQPTERTDVIFSDVEAYHLVGDNLNLILFDVTECPIEQILEEFSVEFESGVKHAWPGAWNDSLSSCLRHFVEHGCRAWRISSSFGMSGFVIARAMELRQGDLRRASN